MSKKAISPMVSVSLLLVLGVVSVIGFQQFVSNYQSSLQSNIENQEGYKIIKIETIVGDSLYIKSDSETIINTLKIENSSGDILCEIKENLESTFQADTRLLFTFDNETYNGSNVQDLSGYGNDGITNGINYIESDCISGGCFKFDGIDDRINISHNFYSLNNSGTISLWAKYTTCEGQQDGICMFVDWRGTGIGGAIFGHTLAVGAAVQIGNGTALPNLITGNTSFIANNWYHLLYTYDSSGHRLYLDGTLYDNSSFKVNLTDSTNIISIGSARLTGRFFNGTMDELIIYSKTLTDSEVKTLYNSQKAKMYEQLLGEGVKEIDISNCNLKNNKEYTVVFFTDKKTVEQKIIKK